MNVADAYATLELSPGAKPEAVRQAYRRLALVHHPDRNGNSRASIARFARITRAYRLLERRGPRAATPATCATCGGLIRDATVAGSDPAVERCASCRQQVARRLMLPGVPTIVVRCTGAAVLLAAAGGLLVAFLRVGFPGFGWTAMLAAGAGLAWLAVIALKVRDAAPRRRRK